jgi:glycosyltransferase involved in cell wall biosynthesis
MRVAYVAGVRISPILRGGSIDVVGEPTNFMWEWREAVGLASLGHEVHWIDGTAPYKQRPDVVFCASDRQGGFAVSIARHHRVPCVLQQISSTPDYQDEIWDNIKAAMKMADALTGVSPVVVRGIRRWMDQEKVERPVHLIPHGIDVDLADAVASPNTCRDGYLYLGALFGHKRVDALIRAFARLGLRLYVLGDGPERAQLEALARIQNAPVTFLGTLDESEKFRWLGKVKALVHASEGEQFWIPGGEAAAARTIAVARRLPDVVDTYGDSILWWDTEEQLENTIMRIERMGQEELEAAGRRFRSWLDSSGLSLRDRSKRLVQVFEVLVA